MGTIQNNGIGSYRNILLDNKALEQPCRTRKTGAGLGMDLF